MASTLSVLKLFTICDIRASVASAGMIWAPLQNDASRSIWSINVGCDSQAFTWNKARLKIGFEGSLAVHRVSSFAHMKTTQKPLFVGWSIIPLFDVLYFVAPKRMVAIVFNHTPFYWKPTRPLHLSFSGKLYLIPKIVKIEANRLYVWCMAPVNSAASLIYSILASTFYISLSLSVSFCQSVSFSLATRCTSSIYTSITNRWLYATLFFWLWMKWN